MRICDPIFPCDTDPEFNVVAIGRSFFIAFYFSFISFSSVGYGDYYPKTPAGRAFFVVWSLVGAGSLTVLFSGKSIGVNPRIVDLS